MSDEKAVPIPLEDRQILFILCDRHDYARRWAVESGYDHCQVRFITRPEKVKGLTGDTAKIVLLGQYWRLTYSAQILDEARMRGIHVEEEPTNQPDPEVKG